MQLKSQCKSDSADDCMLFNEIKCSYGQVLLHYNLQKNHEWCERWDMVLYAVKIVFMKITREKNFLPFQYTLASQSLVRVSGFRCLGVAIATR